MRKNTLKLKKINISFKKKLLTDVNYKFESGNIYLIKSPSGTGKTSLLNTIGLLKSPDSGEIIYNDHNLLDLNENQKSKFRMEDIGFIFQDYNLLYDKTVYENLVVPFYKTNLSNKEIDDKIDEILNYVNLIEYKHDFPNNLSGGEQQRVSIARGLIMNQQIILADEPSSSLDEKSSREVYELLRKLAVEKNKIIIIISHNDLPYEYANIILNIEDTKLMEKYRIDSPPINYSPQIHTNTVDINITNANRYDNNRRKTTKFPKMILTLLIVSMALSSFTFNFSNIFYKQQENSFNNIIDSSIFLTNDTLHTGQDKNIEENLAFSQKQLNNIHKIRYIKKIYEFFEFPTIGITKNLKDEQLKNEKINYTIGNKNFSTLEHSSIQPLYKEDTEKKYLLKYGHFKKTDNFIVSEDFLKKLNIQPKYALNKNIKMKVYVPYALYLSETEIDYSETHKKELINSDGNITEPLLINSKITGIYSSNYPYKRSVYDNSFFMDYSNMMKIQKDIEKKFYNPQKQIFKNFKQKSFTPSSLVLHSTNFKNVEPLKTNLENISSDFSTYTISQNIDEVKKNSNNTKNFFRLVSTLLLLGSIFLIFTTFYNLIKNRKYEIGLLKAIGYNQKDITRILSTSLLKIGIVIFLISSCVITILSLILWAFTNTSFNTIAINLIFSLLTNLLICSILVISISFIVITKIFKSSSIDILRSSK